jgi:hypothetical protein
MKPINRGTEFEQGVKDCSSRISREAHGPLAGARDVELLSLGLRGWLAPPASILDISLPNNRTSDLFRLLVAFGGLGTEFISFR